MKYEEKINEILEFIDFQNKLEEELFNEELL